MGGFGFRRVPKDFGSGAWFGAKGCSVQDLRVQQTEL